MTTFQEIRTAIELLPQEEYAQLLGWLRERDWQAWDEQIANDAAEGKLDFLTAEAMSEKKNGRLKEL